MSNHTPARSVLFLQMPSKNTQKKTKTTQTNEQTSSATVTPTSSSVELCPMKAKIILEQKLAMPTQDTRRVEVSNEVPSDMA